MFFTRSTIIYIDHANMLNERECVANKLIAVSQSLELWDDLEKIQISQVDKIVIDRQVVLLRTRAMLNASC